MTLKWKRFIVPLFFVVVGGLVILPVFSSRPWRSYDWIDRLEAPTPVSGWSAEGLVLAEPRTSGALAAVTGHGVEIASTGDIFGLIRVHHWCGNDPVREHRARVNISDFLLFLGHDRQQEPLATEYFGTAPHFEYTGHGWRIGQYMQCIEFQKFLAERMTSSRPAEDDE